MVIGKRAGERGRAGTPAPALTPELGAAGLVAAASRRGGVATEVERQAASAALMKLLHVPGPRAAALRAEAEKLDADEASLAAAAAGLDPDEREQLVGTPWTLSLDGPDDGPNTVLSAVADAFGLSPERLAALRPR